MDMISLSDIRLQMFSLFNKFFYHFTKHQTYVHLYCFRNKYCCKVWTLIIIVFGFIRIFAYKNRHKPVFTM